MIPDLLLSWLALFGCTGSKDARAYTIVHTLILKLYTTWKSNPGSTGLQHPWGFAAASFASDFFFMALCNWEQKTAVTTEPSCSATSVFESYSTRNGNRSMSLKNVQNGLLCYCRSNQELPFLTAKIWHSLIARCWTEKKPNFWVVSTTLIKSRVYAVTIAEMCQKKTWIHLNKSCDNLDFYINGTVHSNVILGEIFFLPNSTVSLHRMLHSIYSWMRGLCLWQGKIAILSSSAEL